MLYTSVLLDDIYSLFLFESLKQHSLEDSHIVISAMKFAKYYHQGQERKSGDPYYMHPVAVAELVLLYSQKPEVIAASLLHDVVEDTDVRIEVVEAEFGSRVGEMVDGLTRDRPYGARASIEEIIHYIIKSEDEEIALIKIMDRIHNLSTLQHMSKEKAIKKLQETYNTQFIGLAAELHLEIEKHLIEIMKSYSILKLKKIQAIANKGLSYRYDYKLHRRFL